MRKIIWSFCILLLFNSCNLFSSKNKEQVSESEMLEHQLMQENSEKMKKIFFVLPSPIEISLLIKNSGVRFREDLMNAKDNLPGYSTSPSRAIALGVYCADLSYASLNEQFQISIEYMNVSRNLAESLGVLKTVGQDKIRLLESNVTNKELIIDIISEIYMESSQQLREQDRYSLAALMLIGGWVESMYLATQSVDPNEESHQELIKQILDQKLSLESIKMVLRENQSDPIVKPIYLDILQLEKLFEMSMETSEMQDGTGLIDSVDQLVFVQLVAKIGDMRDYLVN
ncbi:hypothetical protein BZG02_05905 [Labilibaculum filiforme]|uniref:Lipoprotein n=1 Tax=Labilibaculum filiforme TaxID=1940526 RepID=A0A2N3I227_9BACT|nr:hypothetical protein [Labilibaculum filiforme]PKQ64350.1 hypothetical protein BZG02_05905 [Labilibaculum filiforme]